MFLPEMIIKNLSIFCYYQVTEFEIHSENQFSNQVGLLRPGAQLCPYLWGKSEAWHISLEGGIHVLLGDYAAQEKCVGKEDKNAESQSTRRWKYLKRW